MQLHKIVDFLEQHAGDCIQYRLRREILGDLPGSAGMVTLQEAILSKPRVKKVLQARQEDGWIGNTLHGVSPFGLDSNVRILLNHGLERDHPILSKAAHALLHPQPGEQYTRSFPGGPALDLDGRGGDRSVAAKILANLGCETEDLVVREVGLSLEHFRGALKYACVEDFTRTARRETVRYFLPGARFPGSNHTSLLNGTRQWRTAENIGMVIQSFAHCLELMRDRRETIFFKSRAHFVAPFHFPWHRFGFTMEQVLEDSYAYVWWLRMLDDISSLGLAASIPPVKAEYDYLLNLLDSGEIYSGQTEKSLQRYKEIWAVEKSWKREVSIRCDLYFTALLILHRTGLWKAG